MANTESERWIYPPNWGGLSDFEDDTGEVNRGSLRYVINFTVISDGNDETDVMKIDLSECRLPGGVEATRMVIERIDYIVSGYTSITLEWDRDTDEVVTVIPCGGAADTAQGKLYGPFVDPSDGIADGTGDLLLNSVAANAGDTYNLTIHFKVKSHK